MSDTRTIEIDFEIHKKIESERKNFSETPNTVLRRLLNIDIKSTSPKTIQNSGRPWAGKRVVLPHGTELKMEYNGIVYTGRIDNSYWHVEGKKFNSPSAAASGTVLTKKGTHTNLNGWNLWQIKRPSDIDWTNIDSLRNH